jgi:hypothetical protein
MFEFHHVDLSQVARLEKARRDELIRQIQKPPDSAKSPHKRTFRISSWLGSLLISVGTKLEGRSTLIVQEAHSRKR